MNNSFVESIRGKAETHLQVDFLFLFFFLDRHSKRRRRKVNMKYFEIKRKEKKNQ